MLSRALVALMREIAGVFDRCTMDSMEFGGAA